jgi:hypothetical protein
VHDCKLPSFLSSLQIAKHRFKIVIKPHGILLAHSMQFFKDWIRLNEFVPRTVS